MGGASSCMKTCFAEEKYREAFTEKTDSCSINTPALLSALEKLSFAFDVKESLASLLFEEITNEKHVSLDDLFVAVESWTAKYADTTLAMEEIYNLIKYVKLYDRVCSRVPEKYSKQCSSEIETENGRGCRLMCPYRCDIDTWAADIRQKEISNACKEEYELTINLLGSVRSQSTESNEQVIV